ncbi:hypothetical protein D1J63_23860 [Streptomyces sp. KPB2]|nr:hypothetical protein D1J63_23860 [Streptomyces sp. KPB2]MBH5132157.1 hypothetical protein [Streptomyces sp. HB-N217]QKW63217.1 hypothetical protein HUT15_23345 [Streptomyces sp. NA03103]
MAHDPTAHGRGAGSPTERLRRGKAASPWQERGTSANSPLAPAPRRRFPRRVPAGGGHTAPRVYADGQTADTVSGAPTAPGCWDGVMAETAPRPSRVPASEQQHEHHVRHEPYERHALYPRHVSTRRRRHL